MSGIMNIPDPLLPSREFDYLLGFLNLGETMKKTKQDLEIKIMQDDNGLYKYYVEAADEEGVLKKLTHGTSYKTEGDCYKNIDIENMNKAIDFWLAFVVMTKTPQEEWERSSIS